MRVQSSHPLPKGLYRNRRSVTSDSVLPFELLPKDIYFMFTAFNHTFVLNLTQDYSFVAPYLVVQRSNTSWLEEPIHWLQNNKTNGKDRRLKRSTGCHYTGIENGRPEHYAQANLCSKHMVST